ncbi:Formin-like protein [Labeo rohita]|uniref:Formin-like protein n=1 Tax=Labeo rohita TaxID=84645 RepID=A0ABQ8M2Z6_LABRO|nr:Formin-like protein [Labeo rohita]
MLLHVSCILPTANRNRRPDPQQFRQFLVLANLTSYPDDAKDGPREDLRLEDPLSLPSASESRTQPWPVDPAAPLWLLAPSSPPWPGSPLAPPGSLIPQALPWSVVDHPAPRGSTLPTLSASSSATLVLCRSGSTMASRIKLLCWLHLGPPDPARYPGSSALRLRLGLLCVSQLPLYFTITTL